MENGGVTKKESSSPVSNSISRIPLAKLSDEKRAKRCRFFRNGDQWFPGAFIAIGSDKHRTWESLLEDLTRILEHPQHLAMGVRHIFTLDGKKITNIENILEGSEYVASSTDILKNIDYQKAKLPQWRIHVKRKEALHVQQKTCNQMTQSATSFIYSSVGNELSPECNKQFIKPKLITVIRNGNRPRKAVRILLNHRTARSFEQVLDDITETIKLDSGAVRKVFSISGRQVSKLKDFYDDDSIFIAYGPERHSFEDFDIDAEECKIIQPLMKGFSSPRRDRRPASPRQRGRAISPLGVYEGSGSLPRPLRKNRIHSPSKRSGASFKSSQNGHAPNDFIEETYPFEITSRYSIGRTLGDGNFAVIKHCSCKRTKCEYALKVIDKCKCKGKKILIESEVAILRKISHPNIVGFVEEFECENYLYLVLELVEGGDLFDAIASATMYTENEARGMLRDLVSALHYLHQRSIVHRDVKPENLLVEFGPQGDTHLKLGDFGLAVEFTEPLFTVCGTPTYVAPEILTETGYGLEVDIWAAGVIIYILLCGFPPFVSATNDQDEVFDQILLGHYEFHSPYWDNISYSAKELITNMIQGDPMKRFTAAQVLSHAWVNRFTLMSTKNGRMSHQYENSSADLPNNNVTST